MRILHWLPAFAIAALIFVISHQSRPPGIELTDFVPDWILHFGAYAALGLGLIWGITQGLSRRLSGRDALLVIGAAALYGLSDEWHQSFIPGRTATWTDWLADAMGATASTVVWLMAQDRIVQTLRRNKLPRQ